MLDKIRSAALEGYIKNKYSSYFENRDFSATLNTTEKYLKIKATLAGEDSQTVLDIENFRPVCIVASILPFSRHLQSHYCIQSHTLFSYLFSSASYDPELPFLSPHIPASSVHRH